MTVTPPPPVELEALPPAKTTPPVPSQPADATVTIEQPTGGGQIEGHDDPAAGNHKSPKSKSSQSKLSQKAGKAAKDRVPRPEIPSGATITLFANFLGQQTGCALLDFAGTATACEILDWRDNSVTLQMPRWGLQEPKAAEILIVLPDGRVAARIPILFVSAPDIVIHEETVGGPVPPGPEVNPAIYSAP